MKFPDNATRIGDRRFYYAGNRRWWCVQFYDAEGNPTEHTTVTATMKEAMEVANPCSRESSSQ